MRIAIGKPWCAALRTGVKPAAGVAWVMASAYIMALAMGSGEILWLPWVALLPLFFAIRVLPPVRAALCGGLWGTCLYVFCVGVVRTPLTPAMGSLLLLSAVPALYTFLAALLTRWAGYSAIVVAAGWIGVELGLQPLGLRHGLLAGTQTGGLLVAVVGNLLGYVFVAFLIALVGASLVTVLSEMGVWIARVKFSLGSRVSTERLRPQTVSSFPRFAILAAHPRAPPAHY